MVPLAGFTVQGMIWIRKLAVSRRRHSIEGLEAEIVWEAEKLFRLNILEEKIAYFGIYKMEQSLLLVKTR